MPSTPPPLWLPLRRSVLALRTPLCRPRFVSLNSSASRTDIRSLVPAPTASGSLTHPSKDPSFIAVIPAPRDGDGPLTERRPNRQLPPIPRPWVMWAKTFPIFVLIMVGSALVLFNYERQSSSVVASTLYALRTSDMARKELGDEIYFRDKFPWIWGKMDQLHGKIDIQFGVKGTRGRGMVRFRCMRKQRMGYFETQEWSLTTADGRVLHLLDEGRAQDNLFKGTAMPGEASAQRM